MDSNVKYVKLTNGEDFVAQVEEGSKKGMLKITMPVRFLLSPEGIGAIPYAPFCVEKVFEIDSKLVMLMGNLEEELYNVYQEKFGTGIVIARESLKLTT